MFKKLSAWKHVLRQSFFSLLLVVVPLIGFNHLPIQAKAPVRAQQAAINIDGTVQAINGDVWTVGGVTVRITPQTTIYGTVTVGSTVHITALSDGQNNIVAQSVMAIPVTLTPSSPTPTSTLLASPTPTFTATPTGTLTTTPVLPTTTDTGSVGSPHYVYVVIEGPVQSVNVNINTVIIYGQPIQLAHTDPVLTQVKVGDWVKASGNYGVGDDHTTIVVVAVTVVIVDAPVIIVAPHNGNGNDGNGNGNGQGNNGNGKENGKDKGEDDDKKKPKKDK